MAAEEGFEPSQNESESLVLPLHYSAIYICEFLVRGTRLELARYEPHAPQTCASADSATLAYAHYYTMLFTSCQVFFYKYIRNFYLYSCWTEYFYSEEISTGKFPRLSLCYYTQIKLFKYPVIIFFSVLPSGALQRLYVRHEADAEVPKESIRKNPQSICCHCFPCCTFLS